MSALRLRKRFHIRFTDLKLFSTALPQENEEYSATPQYPPILDMAKDKVLERNQQKENDAIKACRTVEEKQIKLNMPRFYGFKSYILHENQIPYDNLSLAQHVTRTHLIKDRNLPNYYNSFDCSYFMENVKHDLEESLLVELDKMNYRKDNLKDENLDPSINENYITSAVCKIIHRILLNYLSRSQVHLKEVQTDFDSRIECYWFAGGMNPPENIKRLRKALKTDANEPVDRLMNYLGQNVVALRSRQPLKAIVSAAEAENSDLSVPSFQYDPRIVGTATEHKHIANVPGFWPGDPKQFGMLSYHNRGHFLVRKFDDHQDALDRQGILVSFAWLNAQANHLGFTTYNDITYPLVSQTVITNGKIWSFYVYQMNTMEMHSKQINENPKRNICWGTPEMKLYEEITNGKLIGFNEDVLKNLLKFYMNAPEERIGVNMTPFLNHDEKFCAQYADDDKRQWLEREYKFLMANRPRYKLDYEIYSWEKIYKIDHKTRFMDKKIRPFELEIDPYKRRLDARQANYIPRCLRPELPRWKGRYAKEYFP